MQGAPRLVRGARGGVWIVKRRPPSRIARFYENYAISYYTPPTIWQRIQIVGAWLLTIAIVVGVCWAFWLIVFWLLPWLTYGWGSP